MEKKPRHKAVALKYRPQEDHAPRVVAKGEGRVAEKILELARKHNIYVHNDPDLLEVLAKLDVKEEIPADLYLVVAELLAFIYRVNADQKDR